MLMPSSEAGVNTCKYVLCDQLEAFCGNSSGTLKVSAHPSTWGPSLQLVRKTRASGLGSHPHPVPSCLCPPGLFTCCLSVVSPYCPQD